VNIAHRIRCILCDLDREDTEIRAAVGRASPSRLVLH
jgi:hypothetical protein